ncbi:O-methyltransferase [Pseudonocardia lacus]|uniref:O-methyltransferase n=1 Tax=Pseudonocardia lacus TaxID=2835865 RepID=UPI001BDD2D2A|nr:class I SAM-dependent methyltransferase [Pseudonocardia lacus]
MANSLAAPSVRAVLDRLHAAADHDGERGPTGIDFATATAAERADALAEVYMPISAEAGALLYALVRSARPDTVVEFGTSFGISTLYLAAAVADNGRGRVLTTELSAAKVAAARADLAAAGLDGHVTVLAGDALRTLADVPGPIGLLLLDGWKDLYLPVLHGLRDRLAPGALVLADDTSFESVRPYLEHVRDPANGYVGVDFPVEDGMEISCWTGAG